MIHLDDNMDLNIITGEGTLGIAVGEITQHPQDSPEDCKKFVGLIFYLLKEKYAIDNTNLPESLMPEHGRIRLLFKEISSVDRMIDTLINVKRIMEFNNYPKGNIPTVAPFIPMEEKNDNK